MKSKPRGAYALSGVDIDAANQAKELIKQHTRSTFRPEVLTDIGLFGGMFQFKGYRKPVLVSSVDGVGTKLKIAALLNKHDTIGIDLVNHCVNDILCCGAEPLFFLDYIAMGKLIPSKVSSIVKGLAQACREAGCALIGGETAEMPGIYQGEDYDLAGFIVGVVEKNRIINGSAIKEGDTVIGLPSSGLHTNGYSLVRKIFNLDNDRDPLKKYDTELGHSLGDELLEPHRCYYPQLKSILPMLKGIAHITGGGIVGNLPRILPDGLGANISKSSLNILPVFHLIQRIGKIDESEMFRVFNMGTGMIVVCPPSEADNVLDALSESKIIGTIVASRSTKQININ